MKPRVEVFRSVHPATRQRAVHLANTLLTLVLFVPFGVPALLAFHAVLLFLHARMDRVGGTSVMDTYVQAADRTWAERWDAFVRDADRRVLVLEPRRPNFVVSVMAVVGFVLATFVFGANHELPSSADAVAHRAAFALAAVPLLWAALLGFGRSRRLVLGADGIRIGSGFVGWSAVVDAVRAPGGVRLERRPPLDAVVVRVPRAETADRLLVLLASELARFRRRAAEPSAPLPAAGFRENATQAGWRVRVLDAPSPDERRALLERVPDEELRAFLEETADPSLEEELRARLGPVRDR